jgi:COMPASS component SWD2
LNVSGRPNIAFDPSGLTFAVGLNSNTIKIYDVKTFDKGPFATWNLTDHQLPQGFPTWTSLKFTNDGKNILITTAGNTHYLVDAFEGHLKQRFEGHIGLQSPDNGGCDAGLSPDGRFVFAGMSPIMSVVDHVSVASSLPILSCIQDRKMAAFACGTLKIQAWTTSLLSN